MSSTPQRSNSQYHPAGRTLRKHPKPSAKVLQLQQTCTNLTDIFGSQQIGSSGGPVSDRARAGRSSVTRRSKSIKQKSVTAIAHSPISVKDGSFQDLFPDLDEEPEAVWLRVDFGDEIRRSSDSVLKNSISFRKVSGATVIARKSSEVRVVTVISVV